MVSGVLHGHQDRAAPLAADREALDIRARRGDRGPYSDSVEGRQEAYGGGREAHDSQRDDQVLLAAELVSEVAEDYPPNGRATNPAANAEKAASLPMSGSTLGKNN